MTLNYLSDVRPYESIDGIDDDGIAAILSGITQQTISIRSAKQYFRRGLAADPAAPLWRKESPTLYSGKLEDAANKAENPAEVVAGLRDLWAAVFDDSADDCGTTSPTYAPQIKSVCDYLVATEQITRDECDGFYDLGGGLRFPAGVTAADVVASRDEYNADQAIQNAADTLELRYLTQYNGHIAPLIDSKNTIERDWINAIEQMAAEF